MKENMALAGGFKVRNLKEITIRILPIIVLIINLLIQQFLADSEPPSQYNVYTNLLIAGIIGYSLVFSFSLKISKLWNGIRDTAMLLTAVGLLLTVWDLVTLKFALLPLPFFPGPDKVFGVYEFNGPLLLACLEDSLILLMSGYAVGVLMGLITGILMGWYQRANFWLGFVLKTIGPIPAIVWIPIAILIFPTNFSASVFLIGLAVWFPVAVMTSSGIANVGKSYFEVAKTLGGDQKYMLFRVALPAAMPTIFVGLFMGMGGSFATLVMAEMLGVKAGLGWYINWSMGWADYYRVYAALIIMALLFSGLIALLFKLRDKLLTWQKGMVRW